MENTNEKNNVELKVNLEGLPQNYWNYTIFTVDDKSRIEKEGFIKIENYFTNKVQLEFLNKYNFFLGENGSGKSTIAKEIFEQHNAQNVDNKNIHLFNEDWLNEKIIWYKYDKQNAKKLQIRLIQDEKSKNLEKEIKESFEKLKNTVKNTISQKPNKWDITLALSENKLTEENNTFKELKKDGIVWEEVEIEKIENYSKEMNKKENELRNILENLQNNQIVKILMPEHNDFALAELNKSFSDISKLIKGYTDFSDDKFFIEDIISNRNDAIDVFKKSTEYITKYTEIRNKETRKKDIEELQSKIKNYFRFRKEISHLKNTIEEIKEKTDKNAAIKHLKNLLNIENNSFENEEYQKFYQEGVTKYLDHGKKEDADCPFCKKVLEEKYKIVEMFQKYQNKKQSHNSSIEIPSVKILLSKIIKESKDIREHLTRLRSIENNLPLNLENLSINDPNNIDESGKDIITLEECYEDFSTELENIGKIITLKYEEISNDKLTIKEIETATKELKISSNEQIKKYFNGKIHNILKECLETAESNIQKQIADFNIKTNKLKENVKINWAKTGLDYLEIVLDDKQEFKVKRTKQKKKVDALDSEKDTSIYSLSEGERRLFALCVFITEAQQEINNAIVILDDPFNSVDSQKVEEVIKNLLVDFVEQAHQFFLFSHIPIVTRIFKEQIENKKKFTDEEHPQEKNPSSEIDYFQISLIDINSDDCRLIVKKDNHKVEIEKYQKLLESIDTIYKGLDSDKQEIAMKYIALTLRQDIEEFFLYCFSNHKKSHQSSITKSMKLLRKLKDSNYLDKIEDYYNMSSIQIHFSKDSAIVETGNNEISYLTTSSYKVSTIEDIKKIVDEWLKVKNELNPK